MKTIEQFKDYCMRELDSDLRLLEKLRRGVHIKLTAVAVVATCAGFAFVDYLKRNEVINSPKTAYIAAGCTLFTVLLITAALSLFLSREYRSAFRLSVMEKLVRFLDPNLQYEPFGFVSGGLYSLANLFRKQPERYSGGNLAKGRLGEADVEFSEVLSEYYVRGKGGRKNWVTIFNGLFFVANVNRQFAGQTLVLPDFAENLLGKLGQALQSMTAPVGQLVRLDDYEFEKYFAVFSDSERQARDILTPFLMGRIVDFRKNLRMQLRFSFTGSQVFIAVSFNKSPCRAPLFGSIINFSRIERYLNIIELSLGIVRDVTRNTQNCRPAPALL